jgi:hypothetical protein
MRDFPNGVCTIDLIDSPNQYLVPRAEYTRLHAEWKSGAAFLSWIGHFAQTVTVKGARVEMISDWSAESWADCRESVKEEALKGSD